MGLELRYVIETERFDMEKRQAILTQQKGDICHKNETWGFKVKK